MGQEFSYKFSEEEQYIATWGKIIAHPARIRIIKELSEQSCSLAHLAEELPLTYKAVSIHLQKIIKCGIAIKKNKANHYYIPEDHIPKFINLALNTEALIPEPAKWYQRYIPPLKSRPEIN